MDVNYLSVDEQRLTRSQGNILEYSLLLGHLSFFKAYSANLHPGRFLYNKEICAAGNCLSASTIKK